MLNNFPTELIQQLDATGVVAGFSVDRADHAVAIAEALIAGGINTIELTLRQPGAIDGVRAICEEVPSMLVGVGTILTPEQAAEAKAAGADFGVSPGMNPQVVNECQSIGLPFAPGIATPTELEAAIAVGCRFVKFFPAEASGGIAYLRSMSAPYKHLGILYFPLGGLNAKNMLDYLSEPNVPAIGGSWVVKDDLVREEDWATLASRASEVRDLVDARQTQGRETAVKS